MNYRIGIDIGGTFTDFALLKGGELILHKNLSTPVDRSIGVIQGLEHLAASEGKGLPEFLAQVDAIIHGTIARTWSAWDSSHEFIWTHYELRLTESMLGDRLDKVVISEPGGTVGNDSMEIVGAPRYRIGEEVVLLTARTPIGYLRTSGWGQGRFDVVADPRTGTKVVRSGLAGIELVEPAGAASPATLKPGTSPKSLDGLPLDQFKTRIRALIANRQRPRGER